MENHQKYYKEISPHAGNVCYNIHTGTPRKLTYVSDMKVKPGKSMILFLKIPL